MNKQNSINVETYDNFDPDKDKYEWSQFVVSSNSTYDLTSNNDELDKKMILSRNNSKTNTTKNSNNSSSSCLTKIRDMFNSNCFHGYIIVLIIIECLCIGGELSINYIRYKIEQNHERHIKDYNSYRSLISSFTDQSLLSINSILFLIENIFKLINIFILVLFAIEIVFKFIFTPRNCCKLTELLDIFIIIGSLSINLILFFMNHQIHSLAGLITTIR